MTKKVFVPSKRRKAKTLFNPKTKGAKQHWGLFDTPKRTKIRKRS